MVKLISSQTSTFSFSNLIARKLQILSLTIHIRQLKAKESSFNVRFQACQALS